MNKEQIYDTIIQPKLQVAADLCAEHGIAALFDLHLGEIDGRPRRAGVRIPDNNGCSPDDHVLFEATVQKKSANIPPIEGMHTISMDDVNAGKFPKDMPQEVISAIKSILEAKNKINKEHGDVIAEVKVIEIKPDNMGSIRDLLKNARNHADATIDEVIKRIDEDPLEPELRDSLDIILKKTGQESTDKDRLEALKDGIVGGTIHTGEALIEMVRSANRRIEKLREESINLISSKNTCSNKISPAVHAFLNFNHIACQLRDRTREALLLGGELTDELDKELFAAYAGCNSDDENDSAKDLSKLLLKMLKGE